MQLIKSSVLFSIMCFAFVIGCKPKSEYSGYTKNEDGFWYKLSKFGDLPEKCQYNDYITIDISYQTIKDSTFFTGRRKFQIIQPTFKGSIDECLTLLGRDDSASFIIDASTFFKQTLSSELPCFLKDGDRMKVNVSILDVQTAQQFKQEKQAFLKWIEDFGEYEKILLTQYIGGEKIKATPLPSGLYYIPIKIGNRKTVKLGDTIVVNYEGRFLNGKFFDSTRERNDPFQFVYGQQWQVIRGMEEAIGLMHEGEKALFIIPSELGFGDGGSSTGIIPPFTSLIFEVELMSVKSGKKI